MRKSLVISIIVGLAIVLPIAWYLASPLFIDKTVNENLPPASSSAENADDSGDSEESELQQVFSGRFQDADSFHKVSGSAKVLSDEENNYLRLEDFESTNGPDLKVYLATDNTAKDYVTLGDLKGNIGNQNYEIPEGTDLEKYGKVLIWCEQFSVLFGSADLS